MDTLENNEYIDMRRLPDQRRMSVIPWSFGGASLGIGLPPPLQDVGVYADQWNYKSIKKALEALKSWNPDESPEPNGWYRHVTTGRYRIDGDASLEYVKYTEGSLEDQITHAIQVTQGQDRIITEIREDNAHIGPSLPQGSRCFHVFSISDECTHDPRCLWLNRVYHYLDRYVVLREFDIIATTLATLKRRLVGD